MTPICSIEDMSTSIQTNATPTGTSIEITGNHEMTHKIDRLSLLPNDLVDYIFHLACSNDTPSTGAASKRLLPFHITGIYRRIRLSKFTAFHKLIYTVNERPTLAIIIQAFELVALQKPTNAQVASTRHVETFIRSVTRLQTLNIGNGSPEVFEILHPSSSLLRSLDLPALRHLSVLIPIDDSEDLEISLNRFIPLKSLTLDGYNDWNLLVPLRSLALPLLAHLAVSGIWRRRRLLHRFTLPRLPNPHAPQPLRLRSNVSRASR